MANLGHNPTRWWHRVVNYLGLNALQAWRNLRRRFPCRPTMPRRKSSSSCERLLANMRREPGGGRMEQVLWAASGSEAIQKALWAALSLDSRRDILVATRGGFHGKKGLAGATSGSETDKDRDPRVRFVSFPKRSARTSSGAVSRWTWPSKQNSPGSSLGGDRLLWSPNRIWGAAGRFILSRNTCSCCSTSAASMKRCSSWTRSRPISAARAPCTRTPRMALSRISSASARGGQWRARQRRGGPGRCVRLSVLRPRFRHLERQPLGQRRRARHA